MEDDEFPTVGLTAFDDWFRKLWIHMVVEGFLAPSDVFEIDREHWRQYYDSGYSHIEAFEEDLTCYGE